MQPKDANTKKKRQKRASTRVAKKKPQVEVASYKVPEAAAVAGTSARAIRKGVKEKIIPHVKWGRSITIPKIAFHAWLNSCGERIAS
jgi:excisionase family DNA binding protein